jgi:hypothetical protein
MQNTWLKRGREEREKPKKKEERKTAVPRFSTTPVSASSQPNSLRKEGGGKSGRKEGKMEGMDILSSSSLLPLPPPHITLYLFPPLLPGSSSLSSIQSFF